MCGARAWTESRLTKLGVRYRNIPGMELKYPDPCHVVVASEMSMHFLIRDAFPAGSPSFIKGALSGRPRLRPRWRSSRSSRAVCYVHAQGWQQGFENEAGEATRVVRQRRRRRG